MGMKKQQQYIAIDFLHDDFEKAAGCRNQMAYGGLEYMLARTYTMQGLPTPYIESLYQMERVGLQSVPTKSLSLVARLAFEGEMLEPHAIQPLIAQTGKEQENKQDWLFGTALRASKLFAYGKNIFKLLDKSEERSLSLPIWRDEGNWETRHKSPERRLDNRFFSLNTSRKSAHWVGHVHVRDFGELVRRNQDLKVDPRHLSLLNLTIV